MNSESDVYITLTGCGKTGLHAAYRTATVRERLPGTFARLLSLENFASPVQIAPFFQDQKWPVQEILQLYLPTLQSFTKNDSLRPLDSRVKFNQRMASRLSSSR